MSKNDNKEKVMGKVIIINLNEWTTPARKAETHNKSESYYRQRIRRTRTGKLSGDKAEISWEIPELSLVLVKKD
jgi:hypothetical protein